jgi:hypothetical protein
MTINDAVIAVDTFLERYSGPGGLRPVERRVQPSAEDVDVIKIWIDLGPAGTSADLDEWASACDAAIQAGVPAAASWKLKVKVEAG